ncbi:precorrin-2 C20-methyltransferase [Desulfofarcimen acetoxidans DSM 771]|uniref:Precorrin-2 C20-methyltransferase n=1 Tax=Desulfofarcimen acetoxidans (strain ATCC 49208 / DSM 771 / KCTC 5769 / VKM B-1644 / 5575) TaxID=485916 RepID=C8W619_DESAS|nr:precorrin-2 C(20)-methyltransferase [Desulfofarcimen acetoxidans]ACV61474.1 precorrin-2 C20-methyltransferase [Desulfofarcimen acetoxidans DSM 771]
MQGTFYGVGVGPGEPELITLKAVKILREADVVIAPRTEKKKGSTALFIARSFIRQDAHILELVFPMVFDPDVLAAAWEHNKNIIISFLNEGKNVAFLTLGDPMLYSTYFYIFKLLNGKGLKIETIPGVPSFCAAASRLGIPLAEDNDVLSIVPATLADEKIEKVLSCSDSIVMMRVYKNYDQIVGHLNRHGLSEKAVMISRCGFADEEITCNLNGSKDKKPNYLSTILARKHSAMDCNYD